MGELIEIIIVLYTSGGCLYFLLSAEERRIAPGCHMHAHKQRLTWMFLSDSWHERSIPCVTAESVSVYSDMT